MFPRGTTLMVAHSVTGLPLAYRVPAAIASVAPAALQALTTPNWCALPRELGWHAAAETLALAWVTPLIAHGALPERYPWQHYVAPSVDIAALRAELFVHTAAPHWSLDDVRALHARLLGGATRQRTSWRTTPVWLGARELHAADNIPPPPSAVDKLMQDWAEFTSRADLAPAPRAILAFAQFQAIHPFRDGNGRVSRAVLLSMAAAGGAPFGVTALALAAMALRKPQWRDALRALHAGALEPLGELLRALSEDVRVLVQHVLAARADLDTLIAQFDRGAARLVDAMIALPRHDSATLARAATLSRARSEILLTRLEQAGLVRREHGGNNTTVWHFVHLHALWNRLHEALHERRHRAPAKA
jgi:hypothetical protein